MNKKFAALLIPLMIIPLIAFGYAHFTDEVVKKYKIHVGSVYLNVTGFHVDYAKMPDVDNDGVIFGDELNVTIYEGTDCRWYVEITANPIAGGFELNTTMWMHNGGKLPVEMWWTSMWGGPYDTDPCFAPPGPFKQISGNELPEDDLPQPPWSWSMAVYKWHKNETTGIYERSGPYATTQTHYKPCDYLEVKQHVDFKQPDEDLYPGSTGPNGWQKTWQCKWIKIWVVFHVQDVTETLSSQTWGTPGVPD